MRKLNMIIFSCNRACQVDLLLRSMKLMFKEWRDQNIVITYECTHENYAHGYDLAAKLHPDVTFLKRQSFRGDLPKIFDSVDLPYTVFFPDDDVFLHNFTLECNEFKRFEQDSNITCFSLRLAPYIDYSYANKGPCPHPQSIDPTMMIWNWQQQASDWGYPMSIDGHIFRSHQLRPLIHNLNYAMPNSLEQAMVENHHAMPGNLMICLPEQRIVNVPVNKVQTENNNHFATNISYSEVDLNAAFLDGRRIALEPFCYLKTPAVHWELEYHLS